MSGGPITGRPLKASGSPFSPRTPMTVAHMVGSWLPRTQTWLHNSIMNLPSEIESHVICDNTQNLDMFPFPRIHALERTGLWPSLAQRALRRAHLVRQAPFYRSVLQRVRPAVMHSHFGPTAWQNLRVAKRQKVPHFVTFYGMDVNYVPASKPAWRRRYRQLFRLIDGVICEGPHMASRIEGLGCDASKIKVMHLGVNAVQIKFRARQPHNRPLRVLIAGSFREKKGIPDAIRAVAELRRYQHVAVTIVGAPTGLARDENESKEIRRTIEATGLSGEARLLGFLDHASLLKESYQHDIFLQASRTARDGDTEGGAPITLIEMAATGIPIIGTRHCDIPNVIEHNVSGLLADEGNIMDLAEQLQYLSDNRSAWPTLGANARKHVEREFNDRVQGIKLAEYYWQAVSGSHE